MSYLIDHASEQRQAAQLGRSPPTLRRLAFHPLGLEMSRILTSSLARAVAAFGRS
jgi:hypothetical protein